MSNQNETTEHTTTRGHLDVAKWLYEQTNRVQDMADGFNDDPSFECTLLVRNAYFPDIDIDIALQDFVCSVFNDTRVLRKNYILTKLQEMLHRHRYQPGDPLQLGLDRYIPFYGAQPEQFFIDMLEKGLINKNVQ